MQTQCLRIPLQAEHADAFIAFAQELQARPSALAEVLAEEGIVAELVLFDAEPEPAIILFTRAPDLVAANDAFLQSTHPIQLRMRELSAIAFRPDGVRVLDVLLDATGDWAP